MKYVHMNDEDASFDQMQSRCEEDVEERSKNEHCHDKECAMPTLIGICISIIQHQ